MSSTPASPPAALHTNENKASNPVSMPEHIALDKWADSGFEWTGEVAPVSFERLAELLADEHAQPKLQVTANLYNRNNVLHLSFELKGEVWLTCQRCLQPVAFDLTDDYDIALLDDESQVRLVNESQDYLVLGEIIDEPTPERLLPFKKIVEDEILLKTPLAPKHDDCEMAVEQVGDIPEEENENPFAALAALKGNLSN